MRKHFSNTVIVDVYQLRYAADPIRYKRDIIYKYYGNNVYRSSTSYKSIGTCKLYGNINLYFLSFLDMPENLLLIFSIFLNVIKCNLRNQYKRFREFYFT